MTERRVVADYLVPYVVASIISLAPFRKHRRAPQ
jgi:hypothetical protein